MLSAGVDFFLNIEGVGEAGLIAMGEGIVYYLVVVALVLVLVVAVVEKEREGDGRRRPGWKGQRRVGGGCCTEIGANMYLFD